MLLLQVSGQRYNAHFKSFLHTKFTNKKLKLLNLIYSNTLETHFKIMLTFGSVKRCNLELNDWSYLIWH